MTNLASRLQALAVAVLLATLCGPVSAQRHNGYTEPYDEQYEPVYLEDKLIRIIKDVRNLSDSVNQTDQTGGINDNRASQYGYDGTELGVYEPSSDDDNEYDDDDDDADDD